MTSFIVTSPREVFFVCLHLVLSKCQSSPHLQLSALQHTWNPENVFHPTFIKTIKSTVIIGMPGGLEWFCLRQMEHLAAGQETNGWFLLLWSTGDLSPNVHLVALHQFGRSCSILRSQMAHHWNNLLFQECKKNFEGAANFYSVDDQPCCGPCAGVVEG